jgi:hypothetical protein
MDDVFVRHDFHSDKVNIYDENGLIHIHSETVAMVYDIDVATAIRDELTRLIDKQEARDE